MIKSTCIYDVLNSPFKQVPMELRLFSVLAIIALILTLQCVECFSENPVEQNYRNSQMRLPRQVYYYYADTGYVWIYVVIFVFCCLAIVCPGVVFGIGLCIAGILSITRSNRKGNKVTVNPQQPASYPQYGYAQPVQAQGYPQYPYYPPPPPPQQQQRQQQQQQQPPPPPQQQQQTNIPMTQVGNASPIPTDVIPPPYATLQEQCHPNAPSSD